MSQFKFSIKTRNNRWLVIPILLVSLALLAWSDANFIVPLKNLSETSKGNDFGVFWTASRTIWQGENPYDSGQGGIFYNIWMGTGGTTYDVFISPYYLTAIFMPLAVFPLGISVTLWLLLSQLLMASALVFILKSSQPEYNPLWLLQGLGIILIWRYTFLVMMGGNISLLLLFAMATSYYFSFNKRPFTAGLFCGLLILKPQTVFLIVPLLLLVPSSSQNRKGKRLA
ncbi:MAG: DUF2029 domain-containing protein [Chloroflexi bacterium]|uniref:DUF2029 domain-containing protein n=1 Tax=Candidatus Chlorohelix allophototropha TaxID=3003348 RepID=A0A8T7LZP3_9CHLR|nr:DUF2029 domain-containing protein [Chloroflexota bacterium]WJW66771.1 DUF2029 domain-containing protein [Chloroflexota bacterium L227-S17]